MGDFASLVNANSPHLARAIDSVPQKGVVTHRHFEAFREHFEAAFQHSERTGGYATASRLLAMCVSACNWGPPDSVIGAQ